MLLVLFAAAGAAIVAVTIAITASRYRELPEQVPLHFWIDGTVNTYGPRPALWVLAALQIVFALVFVNIGSQIFRDQPSAMKDVIALAGFGDVMLLMCWRVQKLIIETALSGKNRADLRSFWLFFALVMIAAVALVAIVSH
jgi:uncharacterized membrane protein